MKQLGRVIGSVLAVLITVFSLQALAETTTALAGRDFNHMTTGFPLLGGHATAACETCHVAGVFKGTAKTCDGCHSLGKRVVATPKSTGHIVTDAPCETCHFNSSTFLGARFNHATAQPGQCMTCHNGRQSASRPGSHSSGNKAINSCDQCHRTYAWLPASWNHIGVVPGTITSCSNGSGCHDSPQNQYGVPASHTGTPVQYTLRTKFSFSYQCDACHNFYSWNPAAFKHNVAGTCESCHSFASKSPAHIPIAAGASCGNCHRTRSNGWLPASKHTGNEAGICRSCHASTSTPAQPTSHSNGGYTSRSCDQCHNSQTTWGSGTVSRAIGHQSLTAPNVPMCTDCHSDHHSPTDCSSAGCHKPVGSKGTSFSRWK